MRYKEFAALLEARKNKQSNPRIYLYQRIEQHLSNASDMDDIFEKNSFVSFTKIEKLGINPGSTYDTPLGIYSYPSEYVMDEIKNAKNKTNMREIMPFAGEHPYASIFSVQGTILNLSSMKASQFDDYCYSIEKLLMDYLDDDSELYSQYLGTDIDDSNSVNNRENAIHAHFNDIESDSYNEALVRDLLGGRFWYITMKAAQDLAKSKRWNTKSVPLSWNKLFRKIGIDGCIDQDAGIIHEYEPYQAVFFSIRAIKDRELVDNRTQVKDPEEQAYEAKIAIERAHDKIQQLIKDQSSEGLESIFYKLHREKDDVLLRRIFLNKYIFELSITPEEFIEKFAEYANKLSRPDEIIATILKYLPERDSLYIPLLKVSPRSIEDIKNPSVELQKYVLDLDLRNIQHIPHPGKYIQILAVNQDPEAISYIYNPLLSVKIYTMDRLYDLGKDGYREFLLRHSANKLRTLSMIRRRVGKEMIENVDVPFVKHIVKKTPWIYQKLPWAARETKSIHDLYQAMLDKETSNPLWNEIPELSVDGSHLFKTQRELDELIDVFSRYPNEPKMTKILNYVTYRIPSDHKKEFFEKLKNSVPEESFIYRDAMEVLKRLSSSEQKEKSS